MVANLRPRLEPGDCVFCTTSDAALAQAAQSAALGLFHEAEGVSLILPRETAEKLGFPDGLSMRRIVLTVHSALDAVGLTAAVASALAAEDIPCNVVAAFHHDHVFVPAGSAERALAILIELEAAAKARRLRRPGETHEPAGAPLRGPEDAPVTLGIVNALRDEA